MEEEVKKLWDLGSEEEDVHGKQGFHPNKIVSYGQNICIFFVCLLCAD